MSMISFRDHGDDLVCLPQLSVWQVGELAAAGFRSIVCNRPDTEEGAVASAAIAEAARAAGLAFAYQPVLFHTIAVEDGAAFVRTIESLPAPVAAYCRTGRRSAALWAMGRAPEQGAEVVLDASRKAGCDLEELRPRLTLGAGR
jgi:sulfide:quinone oxidoreductase